MILYLDTSALLKRYFKEPYSDDVIARWKTATEIVTSSVAYAETMASFQRKKREASPGGEVFRKVVDAFRSDWQSFIRVEVTDDLNEYIDRAVAKHPLRGSDAIHLASALAVHEKIPEDFLFACFDHNLSQAAQMEGLEIFPPDPQ
jgi:predicted nucleic acid-binding protein